MTGASGDPAQPSLRRLREFGIRPKHRLGQNFLIDNNILDVIGGASDLTANDVVLEVGGGLGVLSEYLAKRAKHVHVVEIDRGLEAALIDAVGEFANVTTHFADVLALDFHELAPAPTKLIANLPYGVAVTTVIKAIEELPDLSLICAMAQREVAERLAAKPGSKAYGATSVIVQLGFARQTKRNLSRQIFYPVPNVDSSLITLRRTGPSPSPSLVKFVHDGFAHRRKPLAGSLALAQNAEKTTKRRTHEALSQLGISETIRAERLSPEQFIALHEMIPMQTNITGTTPSTEGSA